MPADSATPRVLAVIPARLASQRLPRKVLRILAGKPLLSWTYEAARRCPQFSEVLVAVDSDEVASLCEQNGWPFHMTSPELPSGTDRLHAVAQQVHADIYVNVQADEPLIRPAHIAALLTPFASPSVDASTLRILASPDDLPNPNVVKVVTALDGRALYFSRAAIPFYRDTTGPARTYRHLGLYAYRRAALARFAALTPTPLEQAEKLEQLRLLENGLTLHVHEVFEPTLGVDTEDDLEQVARILEQS